MGIFIKQNKLLVLGALLLICGGIYYAFFSGSSQAPLLASSDQTASPASEQLLAVLASLKTIQLDGAVFSDPAFLSLSDFGVILSPEPAGRRNPFAPFSAAPPPPGSIQLPIPGN